MPLGLILLESVVDLVAESGCSWMWLGIEVRSLLNIGSVMILLVGKGRGMSCAVHAMRSGVYEVRLEIWCFLFFLMGNMFTIKHR